MPGGQGLGGQPWCEMVFFEAGCLSTAAIRDGFCEVVFGEESSSAVRPDGVVWQAWLFVEPTVCRVVVADVADADVVDDDVVVGVVAVGVAVCARAPGECVSGAMATRIAPINLG